MLRATWLSFLSSFVSSDLFLTDTVGLNPASSAKLIAVSKLFDGITDIFFWLDD